MKNEELVLYRFVKIGKVEISANAIGEFGMTRNKGGGCKRNAGCSTKQ